MLDNLADVAIARRHHGRLEIIPSRSEPSGCCMWSQKRSRDDYRCLIEASVVWESGIATGLELNLVQSGLGSRLWLGFPRRRRREVVVKHRARRDRIDQFRP